MCQKASIEKIEADWHMGRRAQAPKVGQAKRLPVKLTDELALDLWAFCEMHHGVAQNRIIEKAVSKFIEDELASDANARTRFESIRGSASPTKPSLQVVRIPNKSID